MHRGWVMLVLKTKKKQKQKINKTKQKTKAKNKPLQLQPSGEFEEMFLRFRLIRAATKSCFLWTVRNCSHFCFGR